MNLLAVCSNLSDRTKVPNQGERGAMTSEFKPSELQLWNEAYLSPIHDEEYRFVHEEIKKIICEYLSPESGPIEWRLRVILDTKKIIPEVWNKFVSQSNAEEGQQVLTPLKNNLSLVALFKERIRRVLEARHQQAQPMIPRRKREFLDALNEFQVVGDENERI